MATNRDTTDYSHGDTGTWPANSIDYKNGDPLDAENLDKYVYYLISKIQEYSDEFNRLDSDDDGRVDAADTSKLVKGNDIDNDGDGRVNAANHAINADEATNVSNTYKNNDIDSDGDGQVNAADQADNATLVKNTDIDTDYHSIEDTGRVISGDAGLLFQTELADGESLNIYQTTFTATDGSPAPDGLYLCYITLDGSGGSTLQDNTIAGTGSTMFLDETGNPFQSYTNNSGSPQQVGFAVDNGQFNTGAGTDVEMYVSLNMRIE